MSDTDIAAHSAAFRNSLSTKISGNIDAIVNDNTPKLDEAYAKLTSLQAWYAFVLEQSITKEAAGFHIEAQNDGLTSSVLVMSGLWRPALKSLRSLIENVIRCLYYMDHPVEYRLWEAGAARPPFQKLFEYLEGHPDVKAFSEGASAIGLLKGEYSKLSNVVHASAKEFRMTDDINKSNLWKTAKGSVGQWSTSQSSVLKGVNLIMLPLFKGKLQGAANKGLREALSLVIPAPKDAAIKAELGIQIIRS